MKQSILDTAIAVSLRDGFLNITRESVALAVPCSFSLINYHYGSTDRLRDAVMQQAVEKKLYKIIAQGLAIGNTIAANASYQTRLKALKTIR